MRATDNERRDWIVIAFILLFGLIWILLAGSWALRFTPHWELDTDVQSALDPNSHFLTNRPVGFIEPVDPAILTNPAWMNTALAPGASFPPSTQPYITANAPGTTASAAPSPTAGTLVTTQTIYPTTTAVATNTAIVFASPTNTFVYFPPSTSTSRPNPASTSTPTAAATSSWTPTPTESPTATSTLSSGSSPTPTNTPTSTATNTSTDTPTATPPGGCGTTITITGTSGSYTKPGGSTCFQYTDTFASGGIFQLTSTGVEGKVDGGICGAGGGVTISDGSTINYGVEQSGGLMMFRITGTAGTVDISISDWTTHPICP